jgi:hypothetical protein
VGTEKKQYLPALSVLTTPRAPPFIETPASPAPLILTSPHKLTGGGEVVVVVVVVVVVLVVVVVVVVVVLVLVVVVVVVVVVLVLVVAVVVVVVVVVVVLVVVVGATSVPSKLITVLPSTFTLIFGGENVYPVFKGVTVYSAPSASGRKQTRPVLSVARLPRLEPT